MISVHFLMLLFYITPTCAASDVVGIQTDNYTISVAQNDAGQLVQIASKREAGKRVIEVQYDDPFGRLSNAFETLDQVGVVFAFKSERDNEIVVVDLRSESVTHSIRCFSYAVSPQGQYVVFERYRARLVPLEHEVPAVILLDMRESSELLLYPNADEDSEQSAGRRSVPVSPFLWNSTETQFLFFSKEFYRDAATEFDVKLVVATRTEPEAKWSVVTKRLDKSSFVRAGTPPDKVRFHVQAMEWCRPGLFRATWHKSMGAYYPQSNSFTMSVDGDLICINEK